MVISHDVASEVVSGLSQKPFVVLSRENQFSSAVVSGFEREHGVGVTLVTYSNGEEMGAFLRAKPSAYDLVVISEGDLPGLIDLQSLQAVDRNLVPHLDNLDNQFLPLESDPENLYSIPYLWGTSVIAYRADKTPSPLRSWKALWDERYRHRTLMVDDGSDLYAATLLASGHDPASGDAGHLEAATGLLLEQVDKLDVRFVDAVEAGNCLLSGEAWICMIDSRSASSLAEKDESVEYFIPEEGAPIWLDSLVIPRESPNVASAHLFIDYLCRAEVAAANSNELRCASANRAAQPFLGKEILQNPALYPPASLLARCRFDARSDKHRQLKIDQGLKQVTESAGKVDGIPRLSLLIWEEYLAPEVMERFEKEKGVRVLVTEVENSEQLKQELGSKPDAYDVVVADEKTLTELIDLRLLSVLDQEKLTARSMQRELILKSSSVAGGHYSVPYLWGLTVLAGRREALKGAEPSWSLIWREDLKVALLDEPLDLMWMALLAIGHDPATATKEQVDEASMRLSKRFPDFSATMMDLISALDALEAGKVDLVMSYNGDALMRAVKVPGIEVMVPKEGAPLWLDSFAISRDAPNRSLAHCFIDFMTTAEASARTASDLRYATPNLEALAMVDHSLLSEPALYPKPDLLAKCGFVEFPAEMQKYVSQSMLRLISESRSRVVAVESPPPGAVKREKGSTED